MFVGDGVAADGGVGDGERGGGVVVPWNGWGRGGGVVGADVVVGGGVRDAGVGFRMVEDAR